MNRPNVRYGCCGVEVCPVCGIDLTPKKPKCGSHTLKRARLCPWTQGPTGDGVKYGDHRDDDQGEVRP